MMLWTRKMEAEATGMQLSPVPACFNITLFSSPEQRLVLIQPTNNFNHHVLTKTGVWIPL